MTSGVYSITNLVNGKIYIGSTINKITDRLKDHLQDLRNNRHVNKHLQYSYNKYGEYNFSFEVLEYWDKLYCISMEQWWINMLHSSNFNFGYNILPVAKRGRGGLKHSQESINKMILKATGRKMSNDSIIKRSKSRSIPVLQYDKNLNFIKEWNSATIAAKNLKLYKTNISKCCKNKNSTTGGYKWRFKNEIRNI